MRATSNNVWDPTITQTKDVLRHLIIHFPTSSGVSPRAVRANERTDELVAQYLYPDPWLFWTTVDPSLSSSQNPGVCTQNGFILGNCYSATSISTATISTTTPMMMTTEKMMMMTTTTINAKKHGQWKQVTSDARSYINCFLLFCWILEVFR